MTTKIMLVDDALIMRMMLRDIIRQLADCTIVAEAGKPELVMPLFREQQPDIVCLDLTLDDSQVPAGITLLAEIKRANPAVRMAIISALEQQEITDQALALGANAYITKPFNSGEVAATLHRLAVMA